MRAMLRGLAITAVLMTLPSFDAPTARADLPEIGVCHSDAELTVGSAGTSVLCVQWALLWMGYYHGLVNGNFDQRTANAVLAFQKANPPLSPNGVAGAQTLTAMAIFSGVENAAPPACLSDAPVSPGDKGPGTQCLQQALTTKHLFAGTVDGRYGANTRDAVKAYQLANPPLAATGVANNQTLAALGIWSGFTRDAGGPPPAAHWWPSPILAEPNFRVVNGIPVYGNHRMCTKADADTIAAEFAKDGADVETQQFFIYIASREGGCNYATVNLNMATRDDSHCTFQINALSGVFEPNGELGRRGWTKDNITLSMKNCADAASDLWVFCSRGPWTPPYSCAPPWAGDLGPNGDA
jgi:peptidoglycan hydrolase-like protein with peptidoglycan-binding domain